MRTKLKYLAVGFILYSLGLESGYGWVDGGWQYRKNIAITNAATSANYQVSVVLTPANFTYANAAETGVDLLFTDTSDVKLEHWIELWDTNADSKVWIKVPVANTASIRMYYGNASTNIASVASNVFVRVVGDTSQSLKGAWNFDEAAGNYSYDTSGNSITGTVVGAVVTNGKFGNARYYSGDNQYTTIASGAAQPLNQTTNDYTLEAWIKTPGSTSSWAGVISKYSTYPLWHMMVNSGYLGARIGTASASNFAFGANGATVTTDTWTHVVVVFDRGSTMRRYVNAVANGTDVDISAIQNQSVSNNLPFFIGTLVAGAYYYRGAIDEVKVYNTDLTSGEISDLYNNYGYSTTNYPGRVLVRKYETPEPTTGVGAEASTNYISLYGVDTSKSFNQSIKKVFGIGK